MKNGMAYLGWFLAGAGLVYLVDVATGKRTWPGPRLGRSSVWTAGRWRGRWGRGMKDQVLARHVRSVIDENLGHPHAIQVDVTNGRVLLRGGLREDEVSSLVDRIGQMPGVVDVTSELVALADMEEGTG